MLTETFHVFRVLPAIPEAVGKNAKRPRKLMSSLQADQYTARK